MKVRWASSAHLDFISALSVLAGENPPAARRLIASVERAVGRLARFPQSGRPVEEDAERRTRQLLVHPLRIIYRADGGEVVVLAVRHQKRAGP